MPKPYATPDRSATQNATAWRNDVPYTPEPTLGDDAPMSGERDTGAVDTEVEQRKADFGSRLRAKVHDELGVAEVDAVSFLVAGIEATGTKIRWQTVQAWLKGKTFPLGKNLIALARFLKVSEYELVPPMVDVDPPPQWEDFKTTPEGQSMTDMERWAVRLFPWAQAPTRGDYRQLLALYRANAER